MADLDKDFDLESSFDQEVSQEPKKSKSVLDLVGEKIAGAPQAAADLASSMLPSMETVEDTATGGLQGMTLGFSDEAVAGLKAGADVVGNKDKSITDFPELYRQYQRLEQKRIDEAKQRSPYAYLAGEVGGGLLSGLATSGAGLTAGAAEAATQGLGRRALQAAGTGSLLGGITGAGTSKGELGSQEQIADVLGSAAMGGALSGGFSAAGDLAGKGAKAVGGKLAQYVEDSPLLRQMLKSREMGKSGLAISEGEGAVNRMAREQTADMSGVTKNLMNARKILGQEIGDAIDNATAKGVKLNVAPETQAVAQDVKQALQSNKLAFGTTEANDVLVLLKKLDNFELTPAEAQTLKQKLHDMVPNIEAPELRNPMMKFQERIDDALNKSVPGLEQLNQKYSGFLSAGPEVLLNKGQPSEITSKFLSSLKDPDGDVSKAVTEMLSSLTAPGVSKQTARRTFTELEDQLMKFEQSNPGTLKRILGIDSPQELTKGLRDIADKFAIGRQALGYEPHGSPVTNLQHGLLSSLSNTGRGVLIGGANLLGRVESAVAKSGPAKFSRELYQAGDDALVQIAQKLESAGVPGLDNLGGALRKGIENKNGAMKNAALFTILQNPQARLLISPQELNEEEPK